MNIEIRSDIPVKYELSAHRLTPTYPEANDILFDLLLFAIAKQKRRKNIVLEDLTVPSDALSEIFSHLGEGVGDLMKSLLSKLSSDELIKVRADSSAASLFITEAGFLKFYKVV